MTRAATRQRTIATSDLQFAGYMRAPHEAKPTAHGLWLHTDLTGRRELVPELIAADLYPGQGVVDMVIEHLVMLADSGFLTIYQAEGSEWIALTRPLRADTRTAPPSECPPPPDRDMSRHVAAVGGARERAEARVRAEAAERAQVWGQWEAQQEHATRPQPPERPLLLDAPPYGCPEHPDGKFGDCGPCGTARRRHETWLSERRYAKRVQQYEEAIANDDEPF